MKFSTAEWQIVACRLECPESIHECLENEEWPYTLQEVSSVCGHLLTIGPNKELPEDELSLLVLEDACRGSLFLPSRNHYMESSNPNERKEWRKYYRAAKSITEKTGWDVPIF